MKPSMVTLEASLEKSVGWLVGWLVGVVVVVVLVIVLDTIKRTCVCPDAATLKALGNSCIYRKPGTWEFNSRRQRHTQSPRSPRTLDERGLKKLPG